MTGASAATPTTTLERPADLDRALVLALAAGTARARLGQGLLGQLAARRAEALRALDAGGPVYGVSTGMGAMSGVSLDAAARARHQDALMVGRAVGSAPWLTRAEARAVLAVRLATFLLPEPAVSAALCEHLVAVLDADLVPAVPARGHGTAGEVVALAHVGGMLQGRGQVLGRGSGAAAADAGPALAAAGLEPYSFAAKEGVALLEGVPVTTALAALRAASARRLAGQVTAVLAAELAVVGASHDPTDPALARASPHLAAVLGAVRSLRPTGQVRALQAPLSFRVAPAALAGVLRSAAAVEDAVDAALAGVTDSPAFVGGGFVGTAGFAGTELTAALDALAASLVHLAETGAARLHRMLDERVTGLSRQLSAEPGLHAGLVAVHKRAVGVVHRLRRFAAPSLVGAVETALGQEDVQSFGLEAAECAAEALAGVTEVLACELLAVHQAAALSGGLEGLGGGLPAALAQVAGALPAGTGDRPFGRDVDALVALLEAGWAPAPQG